MTVCAGAPDTRMTTLALPSTPSDILLDWSIHRHQSRSELTRHIGVVESENATNDKVTERHGDCAPDKEGPSSNLIDEEEHD
jgi:hypothetical protein